ncbi:periplasmic nitrate reductase, NapE protein [Microbulbifer agarilyticus]|uniref:periplasmic nitrate reductase, NapE protein n=1 Tax=Microbulbifer agarilyticus TaxID=260552 RepID=UPI0036F1D9DB
MSRIYSRQISSPDGSNFLPSPKPFLDSRYVLNFPASVKLRGNCASKGTSQFFFILGTALISFGNERVTSLAEQKSADTAAQRKREGRLVLFILVFLFPILAVIIVGSYGFVVWILQMIFGPPGPPMS